MRAAASILSLLALLGCRPSAEECRRLFDHFLDVEGAAATEGRLREMTESLERALAARKQAFRVALGPEFATKCRAQLSRAQVRCALAANGEAAMDHCVQPSGGRAASEPR
jgi:hypothetical protein